MIISDHWNIVILLITAERIDPLQVNEARKQHIKQMCSGHEEEFSDGKHRVNDFWNFVVDDIHGILYCYIPKVI